MSHFSDIGFDIETPEQFDQVLTHAIQHGTRHQVRTGAYVCWSPGDGIEMWLQTNEDDAVVGINPHFAGEGAMPVGVVDTVYNPAIPLDGGVICWGKPPATGRMDDGLFQFMVDMPNFRVVEDAIRPEARLTLQIAAFAHSVACYTDAADFKANSYQSGAYAPQSFMPTGMADSDQLKAEAFLAGQIVQVTTCTNIATGAAFWHLLVETLGGTVDVVSDPAVMRGEPREGGIMQGEFWLSARL